MQREVRPGGAGQTPHPTTPPRVEWELPARPESVGPLRTRARDFARAHGAPDEVIDAIALAVTEAATNAVVHAFVDRPPGSVHATAQAGADQLVVTVADDGRGMRPRPDSPGIGMGLPLIGRLSETYDLHQPPGGGTELTMTFAAPGVHGAGHAGPAARASLLEAVERTAQGAWPGEGVERLVDLLVPAVADACAVDVVGDSGEPRRFAGRVDGPQAERWSAWLASLRPRVDAPESATRAALTSGGVRVSELTPDLIAQVTRTPEDAAEMAATGVRWWIVAPLMDGARLLGLLHCGLRDARGRPSDELQALVGAVAERAARGLAHTQLVDELRRTRRRLERILGALAEAVTVHDADGRVVYANPAAARLLDLDAPGALTGAGRGELAGRQVITRADGTAVDPADLPGRRLLAGLDAPPLLIRSVAPDTGEERWLMIKATRLDDEVPLAVNVIEDVTAARASPDP